MSRNIEIKARVADLAEFESRVATYATEGPSYLYQHDTFFNVAHGRLKCRRHKDGSAELIYYQRPDSTGPSVSNFSRLELAEPDALIGMLSGSLGVLGEVRKSRTLYWIKNTRVHLDRVQGLSDHMELEVTLSDADSLAAGEEIARALMEQLKISADDLVELAYLDLILAQVSA